MKKRVYCLLMPRSRAKPVKQPNDYTCGPVSLKMALKLMGKRSNLQALIRLCKTTRNGTSTPNFLRAIKKLNIHAVLLEKATKRHITNVLKTPRSGVRVAIVSYMYDTKGGVVDINSEHFAVVASLSGTHNTITVFDSYKGKKISYRWSDFLKRWLDYDVVKRSNPGKRGGHSMVRKWLIRPLYVLYEKNNTEHPNWKYIRSSV